LFFWSIIGLLFSGLFHCDGVRRLPLLFSPLLLPTPALGIATLVAFLVARFVTASL
jgi:hypothetical protein